MLELLWLPLVACLLLTAVHVYLGLHVLARGVIFVDLALAQVAALGLTVAFLAGHAIGSPAAYWYALLFALAGGLLFAVTRIRRAALPQEAVIGIVYAVSAAVAVLVVDRAPQGSEHIKQLLVGHILTVGGADIARLAAGYAVIGALHWLLRRPLLDISLDPDGAAARGRAVRAWDAFFYGSFALVVTSSVRIAGVLLVFAYLIVPASIAVLLVRSIRARLALGWAVGALASAAGLATAYLGDLPTGASIVATFGVSIAVVAIALGLRAVAGDVRRRGAAALRPAVLAAAAAVGGAGALLVAFPAMDHHWLDWLETAVPRVQTAFLTRGERAARAESMSATARAADELQALRRLQEDVQWGAIPMDDDHRQRLRQFLAGRTEIAAGDRLVLGTLRARARERQRYALGLPLLAAGVAGVLLTLRRRPASPAAVAAPG
jgi:zinc/manganese transport system permease protein